MRTSTRSATGKKVQGPRVCNHCGSSAIVHTVSSSAGEVDYCGPCAAAVLGHHVEPQRPADHVGDAAKAQVIRDAQVHLEHYGLAHDEKAARKEINKRMRRS